MEVAAIGDGDDGGGGEATVAVAVRRREASLMALVSCLGQGPCFSKITYMVTACKYSEGMYSTVVYCAFF